MQSKFRIAFIAGLCLLCAGLYAQTNFEKAPKLKASKILPANLLKGPNYKVNEDVRSDGYLNYYAIESDFGPFEAQSNLMLATRVHEIEALAELERVSRTAVFGKAAIDAGLSPAKAVVNFVKNPVSTVTGIPKGIGRMFKRYTRAGKEGASSIKEKAGSMGDDTSCQDLQDAAAKSDCEADQAARKRGSALHERYFKVSDAERQWHEKLGTDPYTSNDVLYEAVKSVAWADRLGRFTIKFAHIPSIPGADYVADANKIVWTKDPYELHDYNIKILQDAGVDEATIDAFFDNPWFSPTMDTTLIAALASIPNVAGRRHLLVAATNTGSEAEARFVLESVVAMTWYNTERAPLVEFQADDRFPFATTAEGNLLVILPVDYLVWTEEMAGLASAAASQHRRDIDPSKRDLWLFGSASKGARKGIEELGWTVSERMADVIRASEKEATAQAN